MNRHLLKTQVINKELFDNYARWAYKKLVLPLFIPSLIWVISKINSEGFTSELVYSSNALLKSENLDIF